MGNYDLPKEIEEYVHRIGRTGRLGNTGKATTFYDPGRPEDQGLAQALTKILSDAQQEVPDFLAGGGSGGGASFGGGFGGKDIRSGAANMLQMKKTGAKKLLLFIQFKVVWKISIQLFKL